MYLLNLLVHNNAHSMLSNVIYSSSLAMVTFVGHAFLNCSCALLVQKVTPLIAINKNAWECLLKKTLGKDINELFTTECPCS